ncbi:MAG: hypothetical protein A2669_00080 [Candidatus Yanofskybacteria bacterium RIFCSPHIGHO2_01_FULL_48_25b]|uniref:Uncharacterized protein n=1 Tax=Candidatus Yanofskybacteria bacterium RIFCSPHIGHO2_01_FULL_48_25b TaxID=1802672 RepID=A0A1F8F2B1_9BACT|nr:MAG: hypothetical protein A2669_00080 [Candidatus Yanofskybacteria bacterium RIFCSPHIGHO2_01_FULL_48_25b]
MIIQNLLFINASIEAFINSDKSRPASRRAGNKSKAKPGLFPSIFSTPFCKMAIGERLFF